MTDDDRPRLADRDERLAFAEEVCASLALYITLGLLDDVPLDTRQRLADPVIDWMRATGWPEAATEAASARAEHTED